MKKPKVLIVLALIIAALFSIVFWGSSKKRHSSFQNEANPEPAIETDKPPVIDRDPIEQKKREYVKKQADQMELGIQQANVPIEFWGKVIDQDSKPLESVNIQYRIQQPRMIWDSNSTVMSITTNSLGGFHITGEKGSSFSFESFRKDGYRTAVGQGMTFAYSNGSAKHTPDKSNPKVYTLIKEDEIQGLVAFSRQLLLAWDGVPVRYNLRTGKFDPSGEIQITTRRGKIEGDERQARYDWSCKIEAINGGIIETLREKAYLAPENDYENFWECGDMATNPQWRIAKSDVHLIFRLANGNYGRLELDVNAEIKSKISGRISSYLNPSGGRLLEYDSRRKIK
jgi:hypothetical protein